MLQNRNILLGVTGSIAAYKSVVLARMLGRSGANVQVIMTPGAASFVTPLTFSTLTNRTALVDLFEGGTWSNHVALGRWAHAMIVAPATANTLAKMATGLCDNLLLATYLSAACPVMVAPAMDEDMWLHPSTRRNVAVLKSFGNTVLDVNEGALASGLEGAGRMAEPEDILSFLQGFFGDRQLFKGKRVLITAGPTREAIDPVRYISNHSSGKMGIFLADEFQKAGADVTLILGPTAEEAPRNVRVVRVTEAQEMYDATFAVFSETDVAIMAAAVADYQPSVRHAQKWKKNSDGEVHISLKKTMDILAEAGKRKNAHQVVVGFALETENEEANARGKLASKGADIMVLNSLNDAGAGFGGDQNRVTIFDRWGKRERYDLKNKREVALDIVHYIAKYIHE